MLWTIDNITWALLFSLSLSKKKNVSFYTIFIIFWKLRKLFVYHISYLKGIRATFFLHCVIKSIIHAWLYNTYLIKYLYNFPKFVQYPFLSILLNKVSLLNGVDRGLGTLEYKEFSRFFSWGDSIWINISYILYNTI